MASHGDPLFTFSAFQTWREMSILTKTCCRSNYWFLNNWKYYCSSPPPSCFLHFFTFIYFQSFLASSLLIPGIPVDFFMLQLPRASHSLPCASAPLSPAPPSFQAVSLLWITIWEVCLYLFPICRLGELGQLPLWEGIICGQVPCLWQAQAPAFSCVMSLISAGRRQFAISGWHREP